MIMGHSTVLENPMAISEIINAMLNGHYIYNSDKCIIAGVIDSADTIHLTEGQHRMNAAIEILEETGDPTYVNRLIDAAKKEFDGRGYLVPGNPPSGSLPLPRR